MKIRNGFVSNSSSSSFIINIGVVEDKEKFQKFLDKHNVKHDSYEFKMMNFFDYGFYEQDPYPVWSECDWAGYGGGQETIDKIFKENPDATVFVKTGTGPDGDCAFHDEYGYCDYNVDIDDFDEVDREISNVDNGVRVIETHYGAGRNG